MGWTNNYVTNKKQIDLICSFHGRKTIIYDLRRNHLYPLIENFII